MRARAEQVGGALTVDSRPGAGTTVDGDASVTAAAMIRILLVDDHPVVRDGLRGMLEAEPDLTVVGEAGSGDEAVTAARAHRPDVILMDLRMPGLDGAAATERDPRPLPQTRVVVLTTYDTDADILRAVEAGASGYLLKDATPRRPHRRGPRRRPRRDRAGPVRRRPPRPAGPQPGPPAAAPLSARELRGAVPRRHRPNQRRHRPQPHIAEATVKTHLLRAFNKLDVGDRTAAVTTAMSLGLLPPTFP